MLISALDNAAHTCEWLKSSECSDWLRDDRLKWCCCARSLRLGAICQASVDKDNANQKWELLYCMLYYMYASLIHLSVSRKWFFVRLQELDDFDKVWVFKLITIVNCTVPGKSQFSSQIM